MIRRFLKRFGDLIPRGVSAYRVWLTGMKGTVDPAAMLNEIVSIVGACDSSDVSSLDAILK